jgi:autotransporter-associated beta strand protein
VSGQADWGWAGRDSNGTRAIRKMLGLHLETAEPARIAVLDSDLAGALTKTGAATLTLSGSNTSAGGTTINGGSIIALFTGPNARTPP